MNAPAKDEAPELAGGGGIEAKRNGTTGIVSPRDTSVYPERKAFDTLRAQAARAGVELYKLPEGGYLASRWNVSRELCELPDLRAVREWLARVAVR